MGDDVGDFGSGIAPSHGVDGVRDDMIGFGLTLFASLGICASLNVQKMVHVRNVNPMTGQPTVSFLSLPMWWVGSIGNAIAEMLNLAALGYAPATLVTPLGCLTVVFNCMTSALCLREQFFKRDLVGIFFIGLGVVCVVWAQVGAPAPPITPASLRAHTLPSLRFWILVLGSLGSLLFIYIFLHDRYKAKTCWIYLGESALVGTFTVVSARCFASFLPYPMPGKASYFFTAPDCWFTWGSLAILASSAVGGLLLQNAALIHFKASEVVPIYFCMFAISGVAGSGLAFDELRMPWVLLLFPGVGCCIAGVFAISHRREERIASRLARSQMTEALVGVYEAPNCSNRSDQSLGADGPGHGYGGAPIGSLGSLAGAGGLDPRRRSQQGGDMSRGVSIMSEACSVASVASVASIEESTFLALGGGAMSSGVSAYRMATSRDPFSSPNSSTSGSIIGTSVSGNNLQRAELGSESVRRFMATQGMLSYGEPASGEALLPRCSEEVASTAGRRTTERSEGGDGDRE